MKIGFIGGGMMAEAMIRGLISKGFALPKQIHVSEISDARRGVIADLGIVTTASGREVIEGANIVILAVKPDAATSALQSFHYVRGDMPLLLSICAGVSLSRIKGALSPLQVRIMRAMPNTPCLVGEGATGFCCSEECTLMDRALAEKILSCFGIVISLEEEKMHAVCGLSGSGSAYVFTFIEALADGGVLKGLPRSVARKLAAQTVYGAAKMVLEHPDTHTAELRNRVESPGGTTIAATLALEVRGFRAATMSAVAAATERSEEIGNK